MAELPPYTWKIVLLTGLLLSFIAFILGWIAFGVPDWHAFQRSNFTIEEYYGLWAYCQEQSPLLNDVCQRWGAAADQLFNGSRPNFIRTSEGLITTGMIMLTLGLIAAAVAAILPLVSYLAGILAFLGFLFLVIGVPIFGNQSKNLSRAQGDISNHKRYGFGLMIATLVLEFLAFLLFLTAGFLYQRFGYGNIATDGFGTSASRGRRALGPSNRIGPSPYGNLPYGMRAGFPGGMGALSISPYPYQALGGGGRALLLTRLIRQRMPSYYGPRIVRQAYVSTVFPQPSIVRAISQQSLPYVIPAYIRSTAPVYRPVINLTGRTLVSPVVQTI